MSSRGRPSGRPYRSRGGRRSFHRGRGGRGRGTSHATPVPAPIVQEHSTLDVDFEGDFTNFNIFASQFQKPARQKLRRARGNIAIVSRDDEAYAARPRVSSRGLGYTKAAPRTDHAFQTWEASRPLLHPVKFVPATIHPKLFEDADELLQAHPQPENDHVPTSERVDQIFRRTSTSGVETLEFEHLKIATNENSNDIALSISHENSTDTIAPELLIDNTEPSHTDSGHKQPLGVEETPADDDDIVLYRPPIAVGSIPIPTEKDFINAPLLCSPTVETHSRCGQSNIPLASHSNDSDIDSGDEATGKDDDGADMIDPDLDPVAMQSFLKSVHTLQENQVTIDDLFDSVRLRIEDEDNSFPSMSDNSSDESVSSTQEERELEIALSLGKGKGSSSGSDSPNVSFAQQLRNIRSVNHANARDTTRPFEEQSDAASLSSSEDELLEDLHRLIEEHKIRSIDGNYSDSDDDFDKLPFDKKLQEQWQRDKAKKAQYKQRRQLEKMQEASSLKRRKRGKKNKYDLVQAGLRNPESPLPDSRTSLQVLEAKIRTFVEDLEAPDCLVLPPMDKPTRASLHQLAEAFHLKSKSRGKGEARFTTLFKTSRTGINIKHWKVNQLVHGTPAWHGPRKHHEGEEVGKSAPKIGEGNLGFKMLQQMGWEEGQRIGVSSGLDVPLIAKIKNTKLGLGAAR